MVTVSIVNVTSYTGLELLRLLARHPQFVITSVTARSAVGKRLNEVFPQLHAESYGSTGDTKTSLNPALVIAEESAQTELAFVCLPHAAAAEAVQRLLQRGTKVVDLSADFRLHHVNIYEEWYKHTHPAPALLEAAVYGLCERHRERIQQALLVANPGCHATGAILALAPALAAGIIAPDVIIDSKTGISGAGRTPSLTTHYAEANEDVSAYSVAGHRHLPEIVQELEAAALDGGHPVTDLLRITFLPHLIPMTRGILVTCYADLKQDRTGYIPGTTEIRALYEEYYANEPFVHVVNEPPHTKWTYGSNHCFIYPMVDMRTKRLISISCLDNLVKGASGQAIQNANLLCGFAETMGLSSLGVNP
ncbi:MAG TPA: N-acetyl-gamma-glutamyl-phosphate reductase [Ktedonobacteraceae bacterium]|nr:N-acetyl-gamma-glutamyl-phosphate reductase [Ktedonobacteraceae bacterium]